MKLIYKKMIPVVQLPGEETAVAETLGDVVVVDVVDAEGDVDAKAADTAAAWATAWAWAAAAAA